MQNTFVRSTLLPRQKHSDEQLHFAIAVPYPVHAAWQQFHHQFRTPRAAHSAVCTRSKWGWMKRIKAFRPLIAKMHARTHAKHISIF